MTVDKGIIIKNIYHMLAYAFKALNQDKDYKRIDKEHFEHAEDLFAEILAIGISLQLKHGLHRSYVNKNESLPTFRGKLNLSGTINNLIQSRRELMCEFDEWSEDNLFNQILKSTMMYLIRNRYVDVARKSKLRQLIRFFGNVKLIDTRLVQWGNLRYDKNNMNYQILINICYYLMYSMLLTTEDGEFKVHDFLDNTKAMHKLFEDFVYKFYLAERPDLKPSAQNSIDWNIRFDNSNGFLPNMKYDLRLEGNERELIVDTKYYGKTLSLNYGKYTWHSFNLYQIESYVLNSDNEHSGNVDGMLLYARTQEPLIPDGEITFLDGNIIYVRTLDLNIPFQEIKKQLIDIADLV